MKIGLLTFQRTTNFGSFLQMYALYKCVCNLGFDCEVIDYACKTIEERELPVNKPQSMKVKEIIGFLLFEPRIRKKYSILFSETKKYINLCLNIVYYKYMKIIECFIIKAISIN